VIPFLLPALLISWHGNPPVTTLTFDSFSHWTARQQIWMSHNFVIDHFRIKLEWGPEWQAHTHATWTRSRRRCFAPAKDGDQRH
jgi:hypothetical protein